MGLLGDCRGACLRAGGRRSAQANSPPPAPTQRPHLACRRVVLQRYVCWAHTTTIILLTVRMMSVSLTSRQVTAARSPHHFGKASAAPCGCQRPALHADAVSCLLAVACTAGAVLDQCQALTPPLPPPPHPHPLPSRPADLQGHCIRPAQPDLWHCGAAAGRLASRWDAHLAACHTSGARLLPAAAAAQRFHARHALMHVAAAEPKTTAPLAAVVAVGVGAHLAILPVLNFLHKGLSE